MRRLVAEAGGYYDYWSTGSRASLRELLVNEGLAVHAAQAVAPGFDAADYFGYPRRQYHRLREMEAFLRRVVEPDLEQSGLGLRLRYLSGGMSPSARLVGGRVIPERAGYYLGYRMTEALVAERGIAEALRAPALDFQAAEARGAGDPDGLGGPLLPHAEAGEHPVEHLLDVDRPDELVEGGRRFPDVVRREHRVGDARTGHGRTASAVGVRAAHLLERPRERRARPTERRAMAGAGERRLEIRERDPVGEDPLRHRAPEPVESRPGHRRHANPSSPARPSRSSLVRTRSVGRAPAIASSSAPGLAPSLDAQQHQVRRARDIAGSPRSPAGRCGPWPPTCPPCPPAGPASPESRSGPRPRRAWCRESRSPGPGRCRAGR